MDSSEKNTGKLNEPVLRGHRKRSLTEHGNFLRLSHELLFQYEDMFEMEDLEKIDPSDSKCRYKQYEMDRLNYLKIT